MKMKKNILSFLDVRNYSFSNMYYYTVYYFNCDNK